MLCKLNFEMINVSSSYSVGNSDEFCWLVQSKLWFYGNQNIVSSLSDHLLAASDLEEVG